MNTVKCQACGTVAPANAHHCERCGSADWRPLPAPPPLSPSTSAPVAPETTRSKRNR